jgi:mannosylglucosylglycerate synthase
MLARRAKAVSILLLHYTSPPVIGGVETVLARHARHLARQGVCVHVLSGRGGSPGAGIRYRRFALLDSRHPQVLGATRELEAGRVTPAFRALVARIRAGLERAVAGINVCVVHNALTLHKNLALTAALHEMAARKSLPRTVAWCHDVAGANRHAYSPPLRPGAPWDLLHTPLPDATYVAVSDERQRELCRALGLPLAAVEVVPNGIDPESFLRLSPTGRRLADALRLWKPEIVLLLPARITRRKRIEYALAVVAEIVRRELTVRLVVSGPPGAHNPKNREYLNELRAARSRMALDDAVAFCADLRGPDRRRLVLSDRVMTDLYLLADAVLLPSGDEGFGLPLLEAGLLRLPVFTTDLGALRAIGHDAIHTFGLEDSPSHVAAKIVDTLMRDEGFRFRRRILTSHTWPVIVRERVVPLLTRAAAAPARI